MPSQPALWAKPLSQINLAYPGAKPIVQPL